MPALILDSSVTLSMAFLEEFDDYSRRVFESVATAGALVPPLCIHCRAQAHAPCTRFYVV